MLLNERRGRTQRAEADTNQHRCKASLVAHWALGEWSSARQAGP